MAYTDFTLSILQKKFKINNKFFPLFEKKDIQPIEVSAILQQQLNEAKELPIKSEKARSELIVMPILMELRRINNKFFTIYSGDTLIVDKAQGLTGECDFILAKETGSFSINVPIISVVEAKRQDMEMGINQCAAQLYGARLFNQQNNVPLEILYGCVTTADNWKFMQIKNNSIYIDQNTYYKSDVGLILGIFKYIIDYYKSILK